MFREDNEEIDIIKLIIFFLFFENAAITSLQMGPLIFWDVVPDLKQNVNITKLMQRMHLPEKYSCLFLTVSVVNIQRAVTLTV